MPGFRSIAGIITRQREHFVNFLSSIALRAAAFGLYFAAIPFFLAHQSHETYGIIAFLMMILGYSSLFDNGITYTVTLRYVRALSTPVDDPEYVVGCALPIYAVMGSAVSLIILAGAPWISVSIWGDNNLTYIVVGMALVIFLQIVGSVFASVLLAHNKVSLVNASRMLADLGRVLGIFVAARSTQPLLIAVTMMAVASAAKMTLDVYNCSRLIGLQKLRVRWSFSEIISLLKSSSWMWSIATVGLIVLVYDKWYVSSTFTSEKYSYYSIANDLSMKVYFIFYAFTGAIYTPLMRRHATNRGAGTIYRIYVVVLLPIALTYYGPLYMFSDAFLTWYVNADLATNAAGPMRVMIGAALLYLLFNAFEINLYTKGMARRVMPSYLLGAASLVLFTPVLANRYQITGVAISVLVMQAVMLVSILFTSYYGRMRSLVGTSGR